MGPADCLGASLRETEMAHLADIDQFPDSAGDVLDRHLGIDTVLIEQINIVGPRTLLWHSQEPSKFSLFSMLNLVGPAS